MASREKPEQIKLTAEEAESLKSRVNANVLSDQDKKIIIGLISFNLWLGKQLQTAKLTIHRLKQFFGLSTEKKSLK